MSAQNQPEEGLGPNSREQPGGGGAPAWSIQAHPCLCFLPGSPLSQAPCEGQMDMGSNRQPWSGGLHH